jgi:prepilin-type N-terminal cleavage/methylation domain-containing protein
MIKTQDSGFTLIEVLAAVVILGLSYVAILQNFSVSMKNISRIEKSRNESLHATLAFEELLWPSEDDTDTIDGDYPIFLEGRIYELLVVESEDGGMSTLNLKKIGSQ